MSVGFRLAPRGQRMTECSDMWARWSFQAQAQVRLQPHCLDQGVQAAVSSWITLGNNLPAQAPSPNSGSLSRIVPWPWLCDPTLEASPRTEPSLGCPTSGKRSGNGDREALISPKRSCESSPGWPAGDTAASVTASGVQTWDRTLDLASHTALR